MAQSHVRKLNDPGLYLLDVRCDGFGFLLLGGGRGLGLLLRQVARMHHEKAPRFLPHPPIAVLDLHRPDDAWPMPLAARCVLGPPRLFHSEGQGGVLLSPGCQLLAHRTGAWHEGHQAQPPGQTQAERPSTLGLAIRDDPADTLQAQGEAFLNRDRRLHTVTCLALPHPSPQRQPAIATHAQTAEHLCEIAPSIFPMPLGRPGGSRERRFVLIRPIERNGRGVWMEPGRRNRIALQGLEGNGAQHPVEIGGTQRVQEVPSSVIIEGGAG